MPSLGPAEILVILVVALLVFGPNKMPEVGRQVARGVREFRRIQHHLSSELQSVVSDLDLNGDAAPQPNPGGDPPPTLPPKSAADDTSAVGTDGADTTSEPSPSTHQDVPGSGVESRPSPPAEPA